MPIRRKMPNGQYSKNWYMDFVIQGIRVHRSCKTEDYNDACYIERDARLEVERKLPGWKEKMLSKMKVPKITTPQDTTLSQALDFVFKRKWFWNMEGIRPYTQVDRCIEIIGDVPLSDLMDQPEMTTRTTGVALFWALRNELAKAGLKDTTINHYMAAIRALMRYVRDEGPMPDLEVPVIPMVK